jgi:hypothetical protein
MMAVRSDVIVCSGMADEFAGGLNDGFREAEDGVTHTVDVVVVVTVVPSSSL